MNYWDNKFMSLAEFWAATCSKDPDTKVGAVLASRDKRDVVMGYNGFPHGIKDDERLTNRSLKRKMMQHAERNALDNARFNCDGATLYATHFPCLQCSLSIITKRVHRVVAPSPPSPITGEPSYRDDLPLAAQLLKEAGVIVNLWNGHWAIPIGVEPLDLYEYKSDGWVDKSFELI